MGKESLTKILDSTLKGKVIKAQKGTKAPTAKDYFSEIFKGVKKAGTTAKNLWEEDNKSKSDAMSAVGNTFNYGVQKGLNAIAKKTMNLTDDDVPQPKWESASETFNRTVRPFNPLGFVGSMALDISADPSTYIGGKAIASKLEPVLAKRAEKISKMKAKGMTPPGLKSAADIVVDVVHEGINDGTATKYFRDKAIKDAKEWFGDWVNHPATKEKVINDVDYNPSRTKNKAIHANNLQEVTDYMNEYVPDVGVYKKRWALKDAWDVFTDNTKDFEKLPHRQQYENIYNEPALKESAGKSYRHHIPMAEELKQVRAGKTPENRIATDNRFDRRRGAWVDSRIPKNEMESVAIHELTHDYFKDDLLKRTGNTEYINSMMNPDLKYDKWLNYLSEPTEVHARVMELRRKYNLKPDQKISKDKAKEIFYNERKNMNKKWAKGADLMKVISDEDAGGVFTLMDLFNNLPAVGAGVTATGVALNQLNKKEND